MSAKYHVLQLLHMRQCRSWSILRGSGQRVCVHDTSLTGRLPAGQSAAWGNKRTGPGEDDFLSLNEMKAFLEDAEHEEESASIAGQQLCEAFAKPCHRRPLGGGGFLALRPCASCCRQLLSLPDQAAWAYCTAGPPCTPASACNTPSP